MENTRRKQISKFIQKENFEETDHRLACGWHVTTHSSAQRKRYLKQSKDELESIV